MICSLCSYDRRPARLNSRPLSRVQAQWRECYAITHFCTTKKLFLQTSMTLEVSILYFDVMAKICSSVNYQFASTISPHFTMTIIKIINNKKFSLLFLIKHRNSCTDFSRTKDHFLRLKIKSVPRFEINFVG